MLAACAEAKGLFSRAFVFNGNPTETYDMTKGPRPLAQKLLKETQTSTMEELLQLEPETLKKATRKHWKSMCVPALDWEPFPKALVVSDDACRCDTIEDSLTEIGALKDLMRH